MKNGHLITIELCRVYAPNSAIFDDNDKHVDQNGDLVLDFDRILVGPEKLL